LKVCVNSLAGEATHLVYVDSGSTDGSVNFARSVGASVVELDSVVPFSAARARNSGIQRLIQLDPEVEYAQLIDGDCELVPGWIENAAKFLDANPEYAAASGRLRERFPNASIYNYLCDFEWNTPIGDADACGGIMMVRVRAFESVGGFRPDLIAGEEPELCVRLRKHGWKLRRLEADMALHDVAMTRFSQWWKRATRAGHAYAEVSKLHGLPPERMWVKESRRVFAWGLALPALAIVGAPLTAGTSLLLLLAYPLNVVRIAVRLRRENQARPWTHAFFLMVAKLPEGLGWLRYHGGKLTGKPSTIIEHKKG
jgi:GT2 family glycosyltransferase